MRGTHILPILALAATCALGCVCSKSVQIGDGNVDSGTPGPDGSTESDVTDAIWSPDIANLGATGWRSSTVPWCPDLAFPTFALDVWSNDDAVHILAVDNYNTGMTYEDVNHIYRNDGSGWTTIYEEPARTVRDGDISSCFHQIRGAADGRLYLWQGPSDPCEISWFDDGSIHRTDFTPTEIFVVSEDRVLAMSTVGLMRWDGAYWVRDSLDGGPWHSHAWADEESLFIATDEGIVREFTDGEWRDHDTGTYYTLPAIWGFSREDVWVSAGDGRLIHYNGETWTRVDWPGPSPDFIDIHHMWGAEGVLFLATAFQLTMHEDGDFTVLADWQDANLSIGAIWGNSPTELFVIVSEPDTYEGPCSLIRILRWDGSEFHWF